MAFTIKRKAEYALLKEAVELLEDLSYWLVDEYDQRDLERFCQKAKELFNEREEEEFINKGRGRGKKK